MSGTDTTRRSVLKRVGTTAAIGAVGVGAVSEEVAAGFKHKLEILPQNVSSGERDYRVTLKNHGTITWSNLESEDSVNAIGDGDDTEFVGKIGPDGTDDQDGPIKYNQANVQVDESYTDDDVTVLLDGEVIY